MIRGSRQVLSNRFGQWGYGLLALAFLAMTPIAHGNAPGDNNPCDEPGEAPDIIVGDIPDLTRHTNVVGGITAYSIGTTSCNIGTCWATWEANNNLHPIIGQNMFRLKNGRFEHIGQSWLKHGFTALAGNVCGSCMNPGTGSRLGVNCSDPYSSGLNGSQTRLGPKFEVDVFSGVYPYPPFNGSQTGDSIYKRLQVHNTDLDPAQNIGAQYWVEGQYVAQDDAAGKNQNNNASYRAITVSGSAGVFNIALAPGSTTQRMKTAIEAWPIADPTVVLTNSGVPAEGGRVILGAKVTSLGGGLYHYEYAFHNMTSHRSIASFSVPIPFGANITNIGFHDVDYHSGEPFFGTDWPATVTANAVTWATETFAQNANANALRWGTLYNFRFDADVPPGDYSVTAGIFRPGAPTSFTLSTKTPRLCNSDGTCQPGESCSLCASDCSGQGGGSGCCGNGSCEAGENPCLCTADCGLQQPTEFSCTNGRDDDCDGQTDCADVNCCVEASCAGVDHDGDTYPCDCNDSNPSVWATPGEVHGLDVEMIQGLVRLSWSPPGAPGAIGVTYDVLRSPSSNDFMTASTCLALPNPSVPECSDAANPGAGQAFYYHARAKNGCPDGLGPLGYDSNNQLVVGRTCP